MNKVTGGKVQRTGRVRAVSVAVAIFGALTAWLALPAGAQTAPVMCGGEVATIVGTADDDVLMGTPGDDVIAGLQGRDFIAGQGGDDIICGGIGDDTLHGGPGFDIIFGAQGNDEIFAVGTDLTDRSPDVGHIIVDLFAANNNGVAFSPVDYDDVRGARMFGGEGDDVIWGSNRWDRMQGGPGNDRLYGYAGRDWIRGGPDNDQIFGDAGADDLGGGTGLDWLAADKADLVVRAGAGQDRCPTIESTVQWRGCREFVPTSENDPTLPPGELAAGSGPHYVIDRTTDARAGFNVLTTTTRPTREGLGQFESMSIINRLPVSADQATAIMGGWVELGFRPRPASPLNLMNGESAWGIAWLELNNPVLR